MDLSPELTSLYWSGLASETNVQDQRVETVVLNWQGEIEFLTYFVHITYSLFCL